MKCLTQLAALMLGLISGAMLFIALALVPYWQSLEPLVFTQWFGDNSHFIARVMLPLGVSTALLVWLTSGVALWKKHPQKYLFIIAALCALTMAAVFPLYFRETNAAFAEGALDAQQVTETLIQWQRIHWLRTGAAIVGCFCLLRVIFAGRQ